MKPVRILISILFLTSASVYAWQPPTVFVTSDQDDSISAEKRRELADSARDVREQIKKRANIESAEDAHDADVRVTILNRRIEVNESGVNDWGGALQQTHYQSRYILSFRFESDAVIEESEIALAGAFVTWKRVAGVLAKDLEDWARDHR